MTPLAPLEARLLNEFQRDFPLVRRPYDAIARRLGTDAAWVRAALAARIADGTVSRVGAVFRPNAIGVSTLAAIAAPASEIERVAACVSARPEVNHNYEREHAFNLWFVVTARDKARLDAALAAIERASGFAPVSLPLLADYAIDLGFDFVNRTAQATGAVIPAQAGIECRSPQRHWVPAFAGTTSNAVPLSAADLRLVAALEDGLPLLDEPFRAIAEAAGLAQLYVLARIADWLRSGVVKRFGVVVRHRPLGYVANAMCVWDVPDADADAIGAALAREPGVTLCYRRARAMPTWRYNLFCMIHGRDREQVLATIERAARAHRLDRFASAVLFSRRAFKQCGARYSGRPAPDAATALAA